ncbi:hypothetical protein L915_13016, partial [Phytophthora nicotianae]
MLLIIAQKLVRTIVKQVKKKKEISRLSSKVQYIKKQFDKVLGWDEEEDGEDDFMGVVSLAHNAIWVTGTDNLNGQTLSNHRL